MAASQETCEAIWMRKIFVGLFSQEMDLKVIYCNNKRVEIMMYICNFS